MQLVPPGAGTLPPQRSPNMGLRGGVPGAREEGLIQRPAVLALRKSGRRSLLRGSSSLRRQSPPRSPRRIPRRVLRLGQQQQKQQRETGRVDVRVTRPRQAGLLQVPRERRPRERASQQIHLPPHHPLRRRSKHPHLLHRLPVNQPGTAAAVAVQHRLRSLIMRWGKEMITWSRERGIS